MNHPFMRFHAFRICSFQKSELRIAPRTFKARSSQLGCVMYTRLWCGKKFPSSMRMISLEEVSGIISFFSRTTPTLILSIVLYHFPGFFFETWRFASFSRCLEKYPFSFGYDSRSMRSQSSENGLIRWFPLQFRRFPRKSLDVTKGTSASDSTWSLRSFDMKTLSAPVAGHIPILNHCSSMGLNVGCLMVQKPQFFPETHSRSANVTPFGEWPPPKLPDLIADLSNTS